MILDNRDPLPHAVAPEPGAPEFGICPRCRGHLVSRCLTVWEASYPGQTRTECDRCGLVETPAMRRQMQSAFPVPTSRQGKQAVREYHLVCEYAGCGASFVALRRPRRFCSRSCGNNWRIEEGMCRPQTIRRFACGSEAA